MLLYTDGLLRRTGDPMDRAYARLHAAAAGVPRSIRDDPAAVCDHILRTVLPEDDPALAPAGSAAAAAATGATAAMAATEDGVEDIVLLAARFD